MKIAFFRVVTVLICMKKLLGSGVILATKSWDVGLSV